MSLPKPQKISKTQTYSAAFKKGTCAECAPFKVYITPNDTFQVGVVIPKKLIALSTDRQRLRRRIHGIVQENALMNVMMVIQLTTKTNVEGELQPLQQLLRKLNQEKSQVNEISLEL